MGTYGRCKVCATAKTYMNNFPADANKKMPKMGRGFAVTQRKKGGGKLRFFAANGLHKIVG